MLRLNQWSAGSLRPILWDVSVSGQSRTVDPAYKWTIYREKDGWPIQAFLGLSG